MLESNEKKKKNTMEFTMEFQMFKNILKNEKNR